MGDETANVLLGAMVYLLFAIVGGYSAGCVSMPEWQVPPIFAKYGIFIGLLSWGLLIISLFLFGTDDGWTINIILAIVKIFYAIGIF